MANKNKEYIYLRPIVYDEDIKYSEFKPNGITSIEEYYKGILKTAEETIRGQMKTSQILRLAFDVCLERAFLRLKSLVSVDKKRERVNNEKYIPFNEVLEQKVNGKTISDWIDGFNLCVSELEKQGYEVKILEIENQKYKHTVVMWEKET